MNTNRIHDSGHNTPFIKTLKGILLIVIVIVLATVYFSDRKDPITKARKPFEERVTETEDGYEFSESHLQKMEKELDGLANAEQYALRANKDGYYSCGTCIQQYNKDKIYLYTDEVWRYGVSTKGAARYTDRFYRENNVYYDTEFKGNYYECLVEEKKKIYQYVILPENLKREVPLIRPPMNLTTN
jgi:hypothetical protein